MNEFQEGPNKWLQEGAVGADCVWWSGHRLQVREEHSQLP